MAASYDLEMYRGDDWSWSWTRYIDDVRVSLTGYTAQMQLRPDVGDAAVLTLATGGSGITLTDGTADPAVTVTVTAAQTAALIPGTYLYDFEFDSGDEVETYFRGTVEVVGDVTRSS